MSVLAQVPVFSISAFAQKFLNFPFLFLPKPFNTEGFCYPLPGYTIHSVLKPLVHSLHAPLSFYFKGSGEPLFFFFLFFIFFFFLSVCSLKNTYTTVRLQTPPFIWSISRCLHSWEQSVISSPCRRPGLMDLQHRAVSVLSVRMLPWHGLTLFCCLSLGCSSCRQYPLAQGWQMAAADQLMTQRLGLAEVHSVNHLSSP